jgi:hypothetical protein
LFFLLAGETGIEPAAHGFGDRKKPFCMVVLISESLDLKGFYKFGIKLH